MSKFVLNVQRLLKRIDRDLSGPIVSFSEQFLYGHREILIDYAELDAKSMIKGSVEHGWALDAGRGIRKLTGGRYLYLSWSQARVKRTNIDDSTTVAVGAPFIYACKKLENKINQLGIKSETNAKQILFFPVHGNEFSQQNPVSQIALFKELHDPTKTTVCLYWVEYINPVIYNLYKEAGFTIVCSGFSGQMEHTGLGYSARKLAGSPIGGRPSFILNTIAMLTAHSKIVFGGIGTALFYAAYLKKDVELLHKYVSTTFLDMDSEYGTSFEAHPLEARYLKYITDLMGCDFSQINYNSERFRALASIELGAEDMLTRSEMKSLLSNYLDNSANPQSMLVYQNNLREFERLVDNFHVEK